MESLSKGSLAAHVINKRSLQTFEAVLQNVETWLLERVNQEPGFLEKIQLALRYRATSVQWLDEFRGEVAKQLSQELQNCEGALPANLVEEFQTDGFWRHYVGDWLLTQASVDPPPAQPLGTRQGPNHSGGWKDLPLELLEKIASGRGELKAMRGVCTEWKTAFEASVSAVSLGSPSHELLRQSRLGERFPLLRSMEACKFQVADPCALRGLKLDRLTWCEGEFNDAWLSTLGSQGLPLTSLNLLDCDEITGEGLATWRTLTSLSLNGCKKFSDAGMVIAGSMTLLERLVLDQSKIFTSAGLGELWALSRLQHLSLKHCSQVTDTGLEALATAGLPLSSLDLTSCEGITRLGLRKLAGLPITSLVLTSCLWVTDLRRLPADLPLVRLDLSLCVNVRNRGLVALAGIPTLASLDLTKCTRIVDAGLITLQGASLTDLNLQGCIHLSDGGIRTLISGMPLTRLNLRRCQKVTGGILDALMRLPLVKLVVSGAHRGFSEADLVGLLLGVPSIEEVHLYSGISLFDGENPKILLGQASCRDR